MTSDGFIRSRGTLASFPNTISEVGGCQIKFDNQTEERDLQGYSGAVRKLLKGSVISPEDQQILIRSLQPKYEFLNQKERRHVFSLMLHYMNPEFKDKEKPRGLYRPENQPEWYPKDERYTSATNCKIGETKLSKEELERILPKMRDNLLKHLQKEWLGGLDFSQIKVEEVKQEVNQEIFEEMTPEIGIKQEIEEPSEEYGTNHFVLSPGMQVHFDGEIYDVVQTPSEICCVQASDMDEHLMHIDAVEQGTCKTKVVSQATQPSMTRDENFDVNIPNVRQDVWLGEGVAPVADSGPESAAFCFDAGYNSINIDQSAVTNHVPMPTQPCDGSAGGFSVHSPPQRAPPAIPTTVLDMQEKEPKVEIGSPGMPEFSADDIDACLRDFQIREGANRDQANFTLELLLENRHGNPDDVINDGGTPSLLLVDKEDFPSLDIETLETFQDLMDSYDEPMDFE